MSQFVESIRVENGIVLHLEWHQKRVNETFDHFFPNENVIALNHILRGLELPDTGKFKLRIVYDNQSFTLELTPYQPKIIRDFTFYEIDFSYSFKYKERTAIQQILDSVEKDEVIFTKNNLILDASYANIVLFDGESWWTPDSYLLNGTTRQRLLSNHIIAEKKIKSDDIHSYKKIAFINALNDLGENTLPINP